MIWLPIRHRLQSELIKRGYCVGCAHSLANELREEHPQKTNMHIVYCNCGRIYLYDLRINQYRRALPEEVPTNSPQKHGE